MAVPAASPASSGSTRAETGAGRMYRMDKRVAEQRVAELAENLASVRGRIEAACASAGRAADEVTLVAVTKFFPAADVVRLAELGLREFGENRDQEAPAKAAAVRDELRPRTPS